MHRVFKTREFAKWAERSGPADQELCQAVQEMRKGLVDAHLGGGLVKKRVALSGRGKSGGARTLLATNLRSKWFFVFGFAKNEKANINQRELKALQGLASDLLSYNAAQCSALVAAGSLEEICHDQAQQ